MPSNYHIIIFLLEALANYNIVCFSVLPLTCVCFHIYFHKCFCKFQLLGSLKYLAVYLFMFTIYAGWRFWCTLIGYLLPLWILMNNNGYSNLSFPTILIEKVARLMVTRTLQFPSVSGVLSLWLNVWMICII